MKKQLIILILLLLGFGFQAQYIQLSKYYRRVLNKSNHDKIDKKLIEGGWECLDKTVPMNYFYWERSYDYKLWHFNEFEYILYIFKEPEEQGTKLYITDFINQHLLNDDNPIIELDEKHYLLFSQFQKKSHVYTFIYHK